MTDESLPGRDQTAATCLEQLLELASEITVSTGAISANQMQSFRGSVTKQEQLCTSLSYLAGQVRESLHPSVDGQAPQVDQQIAQRIRAACLELRDLNQKYEALLRHSGRSIALLSLLCESKRGQFPAANGRAKRQTWSCEG